MNSIFKSLPVSHLIGFGFNHQITVFPHTEHEIKLVHGGEYKGKKISIISFDEKGCSIVCGDYTNPASVDFLAVSFNGLPMVVETTGFRVGGAK